MKAMSLLLWVLGIYPCHDAGSILWLFLINANKYSSPNVKPTEFEILQLDSDHMKLIYPIGAETGTAGGWSEATWWAFKKK